MRTRNPKRGLQILDAAAQLFATRRYHEVRMDDIAAHAGVAKGTVYRYYRDKEDLYIALTIHGMHRLFAAVQNKTIGPGDPNQKLHDYITEIVRYYEQYPYFLELIQRVESSTSTATINALSAIRSQYYNLVVSLIRQLHRDGKPATEDPELATLALFGIIRNILRFTAQPWPKHLAEWIYHQFMHGLGALSLEHEPGAKPPDVRFASPMQTENESQ